MDRTPRPSERPNRKMPNCDAHLRNRSGEAVDSNSTTGNGLLITTFLGRSEVYPDSLRRGRIKNS